MAYICQLVTPANALDLLAKIEIALVAAGWTLHDTQAGYRVYSSNGESGDNLKEYVKIGIPIVDVMQVNIFMWWDNITHVGHSSTASGNAFAYDAGVSYILAGNKDLFLFRRIASAGNDGLFGHMPKRFHPTPFATLTAPCISGNGIVLSLSNTTDFVLNQTYWILGAAGEGKWRCNVIGLGIGTITVDNLGAGFSAGAKIGALPSVFGSCVTTGVNRYETFDRISTGTGLSSGNCIMKALIEILFLNPDESLGTAGAPHNTTGMYVLQPFISAHDSIADKFISGVSDSYFLKPPVLTADSIFGVTASGTPHDTAVATAGGPTTITCAGRGWVPNAFVGKIVVIGSGTGAGQTRIIISNTDEELTVNTWVTNPNATSGFYIVDMAYRVPTNMVNIAYREIL